MSGKVELTKSTSDRWDMDLMMMVIILFEDFFLMMLKSEIIKFGGFLHVLQTNQLEDH